MEHSKTNLNGNSTRNITIKKKRKKSIICELDKYLCYATELSLTTCKFHCPLFKCACVNDSFENILFCHSYEQQFCFLGENFSFVPFFTECKGDILSQNKCFLALLYKAHAAVAVSSEVRGKFCIAHDTVLSEIYCADFDSLLFSHSFVYVYLYRA